jgi:hypothetical protein
MGEETVSLFKTDSLMEAIDKAISEIPPDKKAQVDIRIHTSGAEAAFTYRYKDIEAGGYVSRTWTGTVEGGGKITWRF